MSNKTIYKDLELSDRFNVAFPDGRIPNGFIDKTKTRVGITYTNFHDTRNTITVIPSAAIIQDALDDYPYLDLFAVWDGVKADEVACYLQSDVKYKRLVTTPESFGKIITAAIKMKKLLWLFENFFLYLDEVHCYATEAFRENILTPFSNDWVWKFKNMAMGSATPFEFSDPRVQALQRYKLRYKEKFGKITIVNDHSPKAALQYMLLHPEMFPGNVHVFFNTVTESGDLIRATGVTDVNIYCREDERNMVNLEEAKVYFKVKPVKEGYQKFNFYSCRYNDGWDLKDDETATIILVTDVNVPHSLVGLPFKGFQAVGRLKVTPHKIYHITNNYRKAGMRSFEEIQRSWLYNSAKHIKYHNEHIADCKQNDIVDNGLTVQMIEKFAAFNDGVAKLNHMTLDQLICAEYCKEHYNSVDTIKQTWESLNYETEERKFSLEPLIRIKKSQEDINKQVIDRLEQLRSNPDEYVYEAASESLKAYKTEFELLFEAYEILGPHEVRKLGYNDKAMKAALINKSNSNAETKLRQLLIETFKLKDTCTNKYINRYTNKFVKAKLQEFYDHLGMKKLDGTRKIATAEQLKEYGLFHIEPCKADDEQGVKKPGIEVIKELYTLHKAA